MTCPVLTFKRGDLGIVIAMLGAKPAGQILPLPNGARAQRFAFTVRMFDEPRCGSPAGSLGAAKRGLAAKLNEVLWDAHLLERGRYLDVVDNSEAQ